MSISLSETLIAFLTKDAFSSGSETTASKTIPTTERTITKMSDIMTGDKGKDVSTVLGERGGRYGHFVDTAQFADAINKVYVQSPNWETMGADNRESLRIIANKIGRILNGDPEYDDNWRDIAGYATLVCDRINGKVV